MKYLRLKITRVLYYAIKQSDYNVLAKALNWEKLTVNKNESYILMKDLDLSGYWNTSQ